MSDEDGDSEYICKKRIGRPFKKENMERVEELLKYMCNCDALTSDTDINRYIVEKVKCIDDNQLAQYLTEVHKIDTKHKNIDITVIER